MEKTIKILKAIADYNRLRILKMLEEGELCVCEITDVLELAISSVSKHLNILSNAELVKSRKKGKWIYYRLNDANIIEITKILDFVQLLLNDDKIIQQDKEKIKKIIQTKNCIINCD